MPSPMVNELHRRPIGGCDSRLRMIVMPACARNRCPRIGLRGWRIVIFATALSALMFAIAGPRVHAQEQQGPWAEDGAGRVVVSETTLSIEEGKSRSYAVKLSHQPPEEATAEDPWYVFIRVNGEQRLEGSFSPDGEDSQDNRISWSPSLYWTFHADDWGPGEDDQHNGRAGRR